MAEKSETEAKPPKLCESPRCRKLAKPGYRYCAKCLIYKRREMRRSGYLDNPAVWRAEWRRQERREQSDGPAANRLAGALLATELE